MSTWKLDPKALTLVSLACVLAPAEALAQSQTTAAPPAAPAAAAPVVAPPAAPQAAPDASSRVRHPFFIGAWGGVGFATVTHPELSTPRLLGPVLALNAGYTVSRRWTIGLEFTSFERSVHRDGPAEQFAASSQFLRPMAECNNCKEKERGGYVTDATLLLSSLGPRVDVTPFGRDGLYLGASAGLSFVNGLDSRVGAMGTARAGFRVRFAEIVTLAVEGGIQGQGYSGGSASIGYSSLQARLHL